MLDYIPPRVLWLKILRVNDFFFLIVISLSRVRVKRHFLEFFFLRKVYLRIEVSQSRFY